MYNTLRDAGYFLEVLASPLTCFDAKNYGALMIVDSEDEFYPEEVEKLEKDIRVHGLGLLVYADWYDLDSVKKMRFYDDNTRSWWEAATGGANVPALNDLLKPLGIAFAGGTHDVQIDIPGLENTFRMGTGSSIAGFPEGGYLHNASQPELPSKKNVTISPKDPSQLPVLGLLHVGEGRVVVYGDSNCLDSSHQHQNCYDLLKQSLVFVGEKEDALFSTSLLRPENKLTIQFGSVLNDKDRGIKLPERRGDYNFTAASFVLQHEARCYLNAPLEYQNLPYQGEEEEDKVENDSLDTKKDSGADADEKSSGKDQVDKEGDSGVVKIGGGASGEDSGSRDIAAEQEGIQWKDDASIRASIGNIQDKDETAVIKGEDTGNAGSGGGGGVERGGGAAAEGTGSGSTSRLHIKRFPLNVVQFSQIFSVAGGIGLVVLWSLVRRRRPGSASSGGGGGGGRRGSFLLPMFLRPGARARRE